MKTFLIHVATGWYLLFAVEPSVAAEPMEFNEGVHSFTELPGTEIRLTGRTELHLTGDGDPLAGGTVDFGSPDAWLFLHELRPSEVLAGQLGRFTVVGEPGVLDENLRIVQHADGTVVIPHPADIRPLTVFREPHFQGESATFTLQTVHTSRSLRTFEDAISSFRLQRGYMATLAEHADGSGISRVYVAQDADLHVGLLPAELDNAASFLRVLPWRWTGRKGWSGGKEPLVQPVWHYDWDNATTSSPDIEYVPMRHNLHWNAYANINQKAGSTHALGFNEPDRPDQANMTVAQAIEQWPNLLASGLRLGAPAPSDAAAGLDWLYEFIDQADALNYRVDFVPVHFYKGGWSAQQFRDWLGAIHDRTGRPLWVTEFNNGANWTCCEPTPSSQAQIIGEFIEMLDNAPFVERYSIYNWVGANRELVTGGSLTPAGVVYRDNQSPLAYTQEAPGGEARGLAQLRFEHDLLDGSGHANHGVPARLPRFVDGPSGAALEFDGGNDFVRLPERVGSGVNFTFAAWVRWDGGGNWQRIFDFGDGTDEYLFLTPRTPDGTLRFAIKPPGTDGEQRVETAALPEGQWTHVALTLSRGTGTLYTNGVAVASASVSARPTHVRLARNYLGRSQFSTDPLFAGAMDEVVIQDRALGPGEIAALMHNQPPVVLERLVAAPTGGGGLAYSGSLAGAALDPDADDSISYEKVAGPTWLGVAADGTLSGTPDPLDAGSNTFVIRAFDAAGMSDHLVLTVGVAPAPPVSLTALAGDGRATLQWPVVPGAETYRVARAEWHSTVFETVADGLGSPALVDTSVTNGTLYRYVVSATGADGEGAPSPEAAVVPTSSVRPFLSATVEDGIFTLLWPDENTGWQLQSTTSLDPVDWIGLPESILTNRVAFPVPDGGTYYRLLLPEP